MSDSPSAADLQRVEEDRHAILEAKQQGTLARYRTYARLAGPGWLQSAITLGGGSLASALYLGVLSGYRLLWLQVVAMAAGVVMLSAIAYVTLSTQRRPFGAINTYINPVLGWGWAIATLMANVVWALPQFSLGTSAVRQNLLPGVFGEGGPLAGGMGMAVVAGTLLVVAMGVIALYERGAKGIKLFETTLKILVGVVVLCFFGVVFKLAATGAGLDWSAIFAGFVPDLSLLNRPSDTFLPFLDDVAPAAREYWTQKIVAEQRDVVIAAFATAVGINMTFLLPYSMLQRGWNREFRGLAVFDLSTGLIIPFVLATGCVMIAAGSQFHGEYDAGLLGRPDEAGVVVAPSDYMRGAYEGNLAARAKFDAPALDGDRLTAATAALPEGDRVMAAVLAKRDAFDLATALAPLTGDTFGRVVFGIGVVAMALSTIIVLMLISGFTICEILGLPQKGVYHLLGCYLPAVGILGPFVWKGDAQFWLAVPTSVFGMALLPIAYVTFLLMMNSRELMGDARPTGAKRILWNVLMVAATGLAGFGALVSIWTSGPKTHWLSVIGPVLFVALAVVVHFVRKRPTPEAPLGPTVVD